MWARWAVVALVCTMLSAYSTAAPVAADRPFEEMWLAVDLNGQQSGEVALFLRPPGGRLLAPAAQLKIWRLRAPADAAVSYHGERYIPLDALTGLSYRIDEDNQIVTIGAPARLFEHVTLNGTGREYVPAPPSPLGGFLNYDLVAANGNGGTTVSALLEASVFGPGGAGAVSYLERHGNQQTQGIRLDTTWTTDHPENADSLRVGDSITGASAWWGGAVHFGGIQWASNYATRPGLVTMPLPGVAGEAAVPSTLDLYVNNTLRMQNNVPGGPFLIDDVPVVTGEGDIRLVVRDLLGHEQVISAPYYASPSLLRAGLQEYSFETGFTRDNYGISSNDYGRPLIVGTDKMGLTNELTAEVHTEVLRDQQTLGVAGALLLSTFGVLSSSLAGSHSEQGTGRLVNLGFNRSARWLSFAANVEYASRAFARLGLLPGEAVPRLTTQLSAIAPLGPLGSVSVSRTREDYYNAQSIEIMSARDSVNVGKLGYLTLSVTRTVDNTRDTTIALGFTRALNARTSASATTTADSTGTGTELEVQQGLPAGRGFGYRVIADAGETRAIDTTLDLQGDAGTYEVEAREQSGTTLAQASASGGFAVLAGHVFPSRHIDDSFAVVEVGDQSDVRIYRENQLVGRTDADGYMLVPGLRSYEDNSIRVEQADLPLDVTVDAMQVQAVPNFRSGVLLKFAVDRPRGALLAVRLENGEPLPTGALVQLAGGDEQFPSGLHGEVYVTGLQDNNHLRASWTGRSCEFTVPYTQSNDPLPRLGPYVCKSVAP
jgi:outer membrane usher protein